MIEMSDPTRKKAESLAWWSLVGLLILTALFLRMFNLRFGLPQRLHPDESSQVETAWSIAGGDPNPHFFRYPSLMMYLLAGIYKSVDAVQAEVPLASLYLAGRLFSAAAGTLTVLIVLAWGWLTWGRWAALVGAGLLALTASPLLHAHYATVDTLMVLWATLTLFLVSLALTRQKANWLYLAALTTGLAAGTKYNAALLLLPLLLASIFIVKNHHPFASRSANILAICLALTGLLLLAAAAASTAYDTRLLDFFASLTSDGSLEREYLQLFQAGRLALLLSAALCLILAAWVWRKPGSSLWRGLFNWRNLALAGIVFLVFSLTSPYIWVEWRLAAQDFFYEVRHMQIGGQALLPAESGSTAQSGGSLFPRLYPSSSCCGGKRVLPVSPWHWQVSPACPEKTTSFSSSWWCMPPCCC